MGGVFFLVIIFFWGLFSCSYLSRVKERDGKILYYIALSLLILITGFRYNFGFDYPQYLNMIEEGGFDGIEYWHILLMSLSNKLGWANLYFLITSSLILLFYFSGDRKVSYRVKNITLLFFVIYPLGYIESISILRQYISIACFIFVWNRNKVDLLSVIAFVIGLLSHFSFLIAMPFYILRFIKIKPNYTIYLITGVGGYFFIKYLLLYLINNYAYFSFYNSFDKSGYLLTLSSLLIPIVCIVIIISSKNESYYPECNLMFLGVVLFFVLSFFNVQMSRLAYYPLLISPFVIAKLSIERPLLKWFCLIFFFGTLCFRFFLSYQLPYDYLNNFEIKIK
ncbi:EpsG family protein [Aeromonas caviae]|uniref:EpsG family protein n=1 Tax=Aeromonas caviae TaxID=648 RepID=UPI003989E9F9